MKEMLPRKEKELAYPVINIRWGGILSFGVTTQEEVPGKGM